MRCDLVITEPERDRRVVEVELEIRIASVPNWHFVGVASLAHHSLPACSYSFSIHVATSSINKC